MTNRRAASIWGLSFSIILPLVASCGGSSGNTSPDGSTPEVSVPDVKPHHEGGTKDGESHEAAPSGVKITAVVPMGQGSVLSQDHQIYCGFGGSCEGYYPVGTIVTLEEVRSLEYLFKGWGGACASSGTNPTCIITVEAPTTVTVSYEIPPLIPLTVGIVPGPASVGCTVTSNPTGISTGGTQTANFPEGTGITLTANPGLERTFLKWVGGQCGAAATASMPTCKFGLGGPDTEMASFTCTYGTCP
jgi:hypothetical protein